MKKKAIEKIPYFGLKKTSRKKDVKYIGVTAVKIVGHEKHLFLEVYRNKKESKEIPMVRIVLTKKDFGTYWPEKEEWTRQKIKPDSCYGRVIWGEGNSIVIIINKNFCIDDMKFIDVYEEMKNIFEKAKILKKEEEI